MDAQEKKEFVAQILDYIIYDIYNKIDTGSIPESWDGRQLRQLIVDKFKFEDLKKLMTKEEIRDYENRVATFNI